MGPAPRTDHHEASVRERRFATVLGPGRRPGRALRALTPEDITVVRAFTGKLVGRSEQLHARLNDYSDGHSWLLAGDERLAAHPPRYELSAAAVFDVRADVFDLLTPLLRRGIRFPGQPDVVLRAVSAAELDRLAAADRACHRP